MSPAQPVVMPASGGPTHVKLKVDLQATAPAGAAVKVDVKAAAPAGWAVTPVRATTTLHPRGNAVPAKSSVQLDVTIPAGTTRRALRGDRDGDVR